MKNKYILKLILIMIIIFCFFCIRLSAKNSSESNELGYTINPMWEYYDNLGEEDKSKFNIIPEKYILIYKNNDNFIKNLIKNSFFNIYYGNNTMPSSFDLRNVDGKNYVSPNKLQKSLGLCWDFASVASIESTMLKTRSNESYYQDLDNDGIYEDDSHVIRFSERQIDYATAYSYYNLEHFTSFLSTRSLAEGGNFIDVVGSNAAGYSPIYESIWGDYTEDYDSRSVSSIYDSNNTNYYVSETVSFPDTNSNSTQEEKDTVINMIKNHIMNYGAVEFSTVLPITNCYNKDYDMVIFENDCQKKSSVLEGHSMAIVGWIDNYGPNNEGVWIVKNSWSNPYDYLYVSYFYDYANVTWNFEYNGVKSIINKTWDNNYNADKKSEFTASSVSNTNIYEMKYYKSSSNDEELNYINFITMGLDSSYEVYVSSEEDSNNYEFIGKYNKQLPGLLTIDVDNILLNNSSFSIKIVSESTINRNYYINAFTSDVQTDNHVKIDLHYSLEDKYLSSINSISLYAYTENISTGSYLELLSVFNSNNENVTNIFRLDNMLVINGYSFGKIYHTSYVIEDTYTFRLGNGVTYSEFTVELSMVEGIGISGIGTKDSPYIITSVNDLIKINTKDYYLGAHYILNNDLDLSICKQEGSICYNNGRGFIPIGGTTTYFTGSFDGNNHTISNLYINNPSDRFSGLFGYVKDVEIKNLSLKDVDINGGNSTGALSGYVVGDGYDSKSRFENIHVSGNITGIKEVGGLFGCTSYTSIVNCGNYANVSSTSEESFVGGVIGRMFYSFSANEIKNIFNNGNISGTYYSGGLFGEMDNIYFTADSLYNSGNVTGQYSGGISGFSTAYQRTFIFNSYNNGNIYGSVSSGGFIGKLRYPQYNQFNNCYNIGKISGDDKKGIFFGETQETTLNLVFINSFYLDNNGDYNICGSSDKTYTSVKKKTKDEFIDINTFKNGFDFNNVWEFNGDYSYPTLKSIPYYYISSIGLSNNHVVLSNDEDYKINTIILPSNASNKKLIYKSNNEEIAIVNEEGIVSSLRDGETSIEISALDNSYPHLYLDVSVDNSNTFIAIENVTLDTNTINMVIGESKQINASIYPINTTQSTSLLWDSSDEDVITVDNSGVITAVGRGNAVITVTTSNGKQSSCTINVKDPRVLNIITDQNDYEVDIDEGSFTIIYDVITQDIDNYSFNIISSNNDVASVSVDGIVTLNSVGNTIITIKANDFEKSINVSVKKYIKSVTLDKKEIYLNKTETDKLVATISPIDTTDNKELIWTSSDSNIVSVDSDGNIEAKDFGSVTIRVEAINGVYDECDVYVSTSLKTPNIYFKNINNNSLTITWDNQSNASDYLIYRSTKKNSGYRLLATIQTNEYTDYSLSYKTTYYYLIVAKNEFEKSKDSNIIGKYIEPNKVTNLEIYSASKNYIKMSWDKVSTSGYEVYRATSKNGKYKRIKTITNNSKTYFKNSGLSYNKKYYYKVRAYKKVKGKKVYGSFSDVVYIKTSPKKPKLTVSSYEYDSLKLKASSVKGAYSYLVYRSTKKNSGYVYIKESDSRKIIDSDLNTGKKYYYKVKACNQYNVCSAYSNISSSKVIPDYPYISLSKLNKNQVNVYISYIEGASGYRIYRATSKNGNYSRIGTIYNNEQRNFVDNIKSGKRYYYKVRSFTYVNGNKVFSNYSSKKSIK